MIAFDAQDDGVYYTGYALYVQDSFKMINHVETSLRRGHFFGTFSVFFSSR